MTMTASFGQQQKIATDNQSVSGLNLAFYINHTTLNTAFAADMLVLKNSTAQLVLKRKGEEFIIFNDNLRNLIANSAFMRAQWRAFSGAQTDIMLTQVVQTAGLDHIIVVPFTILLPGIINLTGNDRLEFTLNLQSGTAAATVDTTLSNCVFDFMDGVGVEEGIPYVRFDTLQTSQSSWTVSAGNDVVDVKFLNYDKKSYLTANRVLTLLNLKSDKFFRVDNEYELFTKNMIGDFIPASTFEPYQCYQLYKGIPLNNLNLDFNLNSANVTAGENVVSISKIQRTLGSVNRANRMYNKHALRNSQNLPN